MSVLRRVPYPVTVLTLCATVLAPRPAEAVDWIITEPEAGAERNQQLDFVVGATRGWTTAGTPGVIYGIPIVGDGFIPPVNDSFYLQFGAFFPLYFGDPFAAGAIGGGGVRWNFHLTPQWDVFWTAMGGWEAGLTGEHTGELWYNTGAGAHFKFSEGVYLRLETGTYGYATVGLSIQL